MKKRLFLSVVFCGILLYVLKPKTFWGYTGVFFLWFIPTFIYYSILALKVKVQNENSDPLGLKKSLNKISNDPNAIKNIIVNRHIKDTLYIIDGLETMYNKNKDVIFFENKTIFKFIEPIIDSLLIMKIKLGLNISNFDKEQKKRDFIQDVVLFFESKQYYELKNSNEIEKFLFYWYKKNLN